MEEEEKKFKNFFDNDSGKINKILNSKTDMEIEI